MEGSLPVKQKKQPPIPTMGQELRSCDTTQIDEEFVRSLMRTIIRTPIDNGRDPVGIYSSLPLFQAALRSPFTLRRRPRSHHPRFS